MSIGVIHCSSISNRALKRKESFDLVNSSLYQRASEYKLHHLVFWAAYFVFWILIYGDVSIANAVINASITILIHGTVSYFNIYFLIPRLLRNKQYLFYIVSVMLSIGLSILLLSVAFYTANTISPAVKDNLLDTGFLFANAVSVAYTLGITTSLKLVKQWYERERQTKDLERLNMETELKYLKSQINPHFLFNSLNSLYALTLRKSDEAPNLVLKLSDILRYVLYEGGTRWVELDKEINYIQSYLDLEKLRNGDRLDITFDVTGSTFGVKIAPMLFLTFIENSFKHGISKKAEGGYVNIQLEVLENEVRFSICNSKVDEKEERLNGNQGGIGLQNVRKRLNLLYPDRHRILITDKRETYCVHVNLNTEPNPDNNLKEIPYEMHDR